MKRLEKELRSEYNQLVFGVNRKMLKIDFNYLSLGELLKLENKGVYDIIILYRIYKRY